MEYQAGENTVAYTEAGDVKLDRRKLHTGLFEFPSSHYHGLTVVFDLEIIKSSLPAEIRNFPVTPESIISRWKLGRYPRVIHGRSGWSTFSGRCTRFRRKSALLI